METRYSDEQVRSILVRAMGQTDREGFSRSQLEDMAAELGIDSEALERAERQPDKAVAAVADPGRDRKRRSEFRDQLKTYAAVNGFLLLLNVAISGAVTWAIYPILGWGLGLVLFPAQMKPCGQVGRCGDRAALNAKREDA